MQGIVLIYDITRSEYYENLPKWIQLINDTTFNIPVVLVGNKIDDENENRNVRTEEGKDFANDNGYLFYEVSVLNGKNINNAINALSEVIISTLEYSISMNTSQSTIDFFGITDKKKAKNYSRKKMLLI